MGILRQITSLARHSAIYAVSTAIQKLPGFLLLPIYTNFQYIPTTSDFSDFVMVFTFIAFMNFFYTYGMDSAMLRYFFIGGRERRDVFSATFFVLVLTSLATTVLLVIFSERLAVLILQGGQYAGYIRLAAMILLFDALGNLPYLVLRAEEKPVQFTLFKALRFVLELLANVYFVVFMRQGVMGILYASLLVSVINFLVMAPIILRHLTRRFDWRLAAQMLKFGLPFLPHGIAYTIIELIDRFIIQEILGKEAVALYGANYKFGALLSLLIHAFRNAWQPFFLKISSQPDARQIYARVLTYFAVGAGAIVIAGTFFVRDLLTFPFFGKFHVLSEEAYWAGIPIIPIVLLSYCFYGIYVVLTPGFYILKKSQYMVLFTGSAALVNIAANVILLTYMQNIWAAAWATLVSYFTMALTIYWVSSRIYPLPVEWRRLAKMFTLILLSMALYYFFEPPLLVRLAVLGMAALYVLYAVFEARERKGLMAALSFRPRRGENSSGENRADR